MDFKSLTALIISLALSSLLIPAEQFQILSNDAVKVFDSIWQYFGKLRSAHKTGKSQFSF